jgi:iron complex outermembrane recepter protein
VQHLSQRLATRVVCILIVLKITAIAVAQTPPFITGTVRDVTGLPLSRAIVTMTTSGGEVVATTTTDGAGRYRIDPLSPGRYLVTAASAGFARQSRELVIESGSRAVDFDLPVDVLTQTVTVSAQSPDSFHTQTATSALRTDVPLMDVPQAVSIVPSEILQQQEIREVGDVARTVSGMGRAVGYSEWADKFMVRGLLIDYALKNGFKNSSMLSFSDMANVERIEVLKGPSSLLYGRIEPGGVVNIVTKQPLSVHRQSAEFTVGRYGITRGVFDVTGPLSASGDVSFRLIGAGQHSGSHRDFVSRDGGFFGPSLSWKASDRTTVTVEGEALKTTGVPDAGLPSNPVSFTLPVSLSVGEPDRDSIRNQNLRAAYYLTHRFNDRWSFTQAASVLRADAYRKQVYAPDGAMQRDGRTFARQVLDEAEAALNHFARFDLVGKPAVAGQPHVLLASVEIGRERYENGLSSLRLAPIDVFEPAYGSPFPTTPDPPQQIRRQGANSLGVVIQDQWTVASKWKVALGGRADVARTMYLDHVNQPPDAGAAPPTSVGFPGSGGPPPTPPAIAQTIDPNHRESSEHVSAFSPRLGVVFQPNGSTSLYVSYSKSFNPLQLIHYINIVNIDPFRAAQYEGGIKLDLFGARLQTTAAIFSIEANGYPLPTGRLGQFSNDGFKRSNGFEVESTAHPGPWSLIAAYTFNDGNKQIGFPGQSLMNAARNSGSMWATWTRREGSLRGLTLGGGMFAVGDRVANLFETLEIPSYARIDGLVRYEHAKWNLQLNLKNVTSERYYDTDAVQGLLLPGAPFSPELTFRLKL